MTADSDCVRCLTGQTNRLELELTAPKAAESLSRTGRFEEASEWRIGTEMTRGIELIEGGFRVRCETDSAFEADVATEEEALAGLLLLSRLQQSLFYAIGWAGWVSKAQRDVDDPPRPWSPSTRNECERYLAGLWLEGRDRAKAIAQEAAPRIERGDAWAQGISRLRPVPEPYPDPEDPARHTWTEAQTDGAGLRFTSASPSVNRAAQFMLVHERLADDIPRVRRWHTPVGAAKENP